VSALRDLQKTSGHNSTRFGKLSSPHASHFITTGTSSAASPKFLFLKSPRSRTRDFRVEFAALMRSGGLERPLFGKLPIEAWAEPALSTISSRTKNWPHFAQECSLGSRFAQDCLGNGLLRQDLAKIRYGQLLFRGSRAIIPPSAEYSRRRRQNQHLAAPERSK
jgi:hypothetical protein